ncbi:hypothetical protein DXU07_27770 [Bradyrhizobium elkanii]|nr:hypothetical protein [Bradyrhizobium elkanii]NWL74136.1 hypothetical protein [Bradyrhizobium elkanii]RYM15931.1 hypothetical protein EWH13_39600 [Bradyrhizobium elkanii]
MRRPGLHQLPVADQQGPARALAFCRVGSALRHGRARPGHPRLYCVAEAKTWMPGTRPGMTS